MTDTDLDAYRAATESVALFDLTGRSTIELRGSDRQAFLHNFCTNDIKRLTPGEGCEAFITNIKGRILGHILVSATDNALWLDSEPGTAEFLVAHLDKYIVTEDVLVADRSADFAPLLLTGPQAQTWLIGKVDGLTPPPLCGLFRGKLAGVDVMIRRVGFTEQPAFEVIPRASEFAHVWQTVTEAGVQPTGPEVFEALRIEAGFPRYGVDLTDANIAQEAARTAQAISFTKGCYLGQEPIARLDALGHVNKELRRLQLSAGPVPTPGTPVHSPSGNPAGHITSAALSPPTGQPVALAMLKTTALSAGTELTVADMPATVVSPRTATS